MENLLEDLKNYCDEIAHDDLRYIKLKQKIYQITETKNELKENCFCKGYDNNGKLLIIKIDKIITGYTLSGTVVFSDNSSFMVGNYSDSWKTIHFKKI